MVRAKRAREGSIQDIRPKQKEIPPPKIEEIKERIEVNIERVEFQTNKNPNRNKSKYFLWFVALCSLVFCFFAISLLFAKATISINPKTENVTLNETLSATKDSNANGLSFDLVVIPGQESQTVATTGEKKCFRERNRYRSYF